MPVNKVPKIEPTTWLVTAIYPMVSTGEEGAMGSPMAKYPVVAKGEQDAVETFLSCPVFKGEHGGWLKPTNAVLVFAEEFQDDEDEASDETV